MEPIHETIPSWRWSGDGTACPLVLPEPPVEPPEAPTSQRPDLSAGEPSFPTGASREDERHEQTAWQFCRDVVVFTVAGLVCVALLNLIVNPYAQYPVRIVAPVIQTSRGEKLALLSAYSPAPQGLILGSSRVMKLEPSYLEQVTGQRFFNAGVNFGRPEDFLALWRFYRAHFGEAPRSLVIGLDVAALTDGIPIDARLLTDPQLGHLVPEAATWSDHGRRWQELISWQQTVSSLKSLRRLARPSVETRPVESLLPDGRLIYHQREQALAAGTYDFAGPLSFNQQEYQRIFAAFRQISGRRARILEQLLSECQAAGTDVTLFITPNHPELEQHLQTVPNYSERRSQVLALAQSLADRYACRFVDLSTIDRFAGDPANFVDGVHPLEANTRRMIDRLVQPSASTW